MLTSLLSFDGQSWTFCIEMFIRLLIACFCGFLIGYERTKHFKEAGIRTHVIVCLAAALMMIISKYGFSDLVNLEGTVFSGVKEADPSRIASQIVSGVSFLGAGVIFHNTNGTKGLTTAAGIWATAGIGMAIGGGMYLLGIFAAVVIFLFQSVVRKFDIAGDALHTSRLKFTVKNTAEFRKAFDEYVSSTKGQILESEIKFDDDGYAKYNITIRANHDFTIDEISSFLETAGEVKSVSCVSMNTLQN